MAEPARPDVRYTAFLSYSHKDSAAAGRLHRRLEAYRMPKRLAGSEGARGPVPERLWPIFRDREELPAATDLSETVRAALAQSGALIILCSPDAAGSLWVAEEIETFRTLHPDRPILAAILDGEPPDCFPAALRAFSRDGTWHEPLATDLRPGKDGKQLGLLKLVAGITGVGLDALVQRDAARRVRRITTLSTLALIAMLIMAALAVVALDARREAERQRGEAEGLVKFMHTDLRTRLKGVGRLDVMEVVNQRALAYYDRQIERGEFPTDPTMRAQVVHAIGDDLIRGGDFEAARARFDEAYRETEQLLGQAPDDPERIYSHAQSEYWLGYVDYLAGNRAEAPQAQARYRSNTRRAWNQYRLLADRLLAMDITNPRSIREAGFAYGNLCTIDLSPPPSASAALAHCQRALQLIGQVQALQPSHLELKADLANRHAWLAMGLIANRRWDDAERHRALHESLVGELIAADPSNLDYRDILMQSQFGFGQLLAEAARGDEARRLFVKAASIARDLSARDPDNASWREWQRRIATAIEEQRP